VRKEGEYYVRANRGGMMRLRWGYGGQKNCVG